MILIAEAERRGSLRLPRVGVNIGRTHTDVIFGYGEPNEALERQKVAACIIKRATGWHIVGSLSFDCFKAHKTRKAAIDEVRRWRCGLN